MKRALVVLAALFLTVGCANPKSLVFTEKNKEEVLKKVAESKSLTVEEKQLVLGYWMRAEMVKGIGKIFGGADTPAKDAPNAFGKTVAQVIEEQKVWIEKEKAAEAEAKVREEKAKKLAEEAKAREEARLAELRKAVLLTVFDMKEKEQNYSEGMAFKIAYENTSEKDIRAFEGLLSFRDVLGEKLDGGRLKETDLLKAGQKRTAAKWIRFSFIGGSLRGKKLEDLKVEWKPTTVLFVDGSRLDLEEGKETP